MLGRCGPIATLTSSVLVRLVKTMSFIGSLLIPRSQLLLKASRSIGKSLFMTTPTCFKCKLS
ncbi:MAG: hypothetical protein AUG06_07845 [Actinobacteria bacterium 13_1_20CM_2_65_11]|nr:MAG: hypothetical protein AUH40_01065 [Chloroflexi bacterium 13_1_40CM_65_17]OLE79366.1 MAG: hypothetical protein AUG06_07845 [Actinobacteria bacterium 13_1_20CM_2_65_11]